MKPPPTVAVKHPLHLRAERVDMFSDDIAMVATDVHGNRVIIVASRARWSEALQPSLGPRPSPAETARGMYLRGEVEVDVFERALEQERW